jgi:hypothetical protein
MIRKNKKYAPHHRGRRGCDLMVVGFTTNYAISAYHHLCCEFESRSWRDVLAKNTHHIIGPIPKSNGKNVE